MLEIDLIASNLSRRFKVPQELILAVARQESGVNPWLWRSEPAYRYLWDNATGKPFRALTHAENASETPPSDFGPALGGQSIDTEWWGQQASWGPMQVIGAVAREHGFTHAFPKLCDLLVGMEYGVRHLAALRDAYLARFGWAGVVAAYNAGSPRRVNGRWVNQDYVDGVAAKGAAALLGAG